MYSLSLFGVIFCYNNPKILSIVLTMSFLNRFIGSPYVPSARSILMVALGLLFLMSLLMVASASIPFVMGRENFSSLKFFLSQLGYMLIALMAGFFIYFVPLKKYYSIPVQFFLWGVVIFLLAATAAFGQNINGSKRWLSVLGFSFQPAEFAKMLIVPIVARYMATESSRLRHHNILMSVIFIGMAYLPILLFLIFQPDFGSVVVIAATIMVMFFVGGAQSIQYLGLVAMGLIAGGLGIWFADYRLTRAKSFLDPFDDVLDTDYQLSRSLVAFARGDWMGVGYGNSIQKLEHLPEAHTDFLLAITGEELGFLGVFLVIALEFAILGAIMRIGHKALIRRQLRLSYTTFGFAVVLFGQVLINAGMNMGILPTKGLTMPFFSYGGSSMLFSVIMVAIILKIDKESLAIHRQEESREY